jgi:hypothetical protein
MATRVVGAKEGEGGKAVANATSMAAEQWRGPRRGRWRRQRGWRARKGAMAMAAKAMAMAMKVMGDKEGKGGKVMAMETRMAGKQQ